MPVRDRRALVATFVMSACLAGMVAVPALAADGSDAERAREIELEQAIGEAGAAEVAALAELEALQRQRALVEDDLAQLESDVARAFGLAGDAERRADRAAATYQSLHFELEAAEERARIANARRVDATSDAYENARGGHDFDSILGWGTDEFSTAGARSEFLDAIADERREISDEAEAATRELARLREEAAAVKRQAETALDDARDELARVEQLRREQAELSAQLRNAEQLEIQLIASIRERKDEYEAELAKLSVDSGSIGDMLAAAQASQIRSEPVMVARPVPGPIVSEFGPRLHPILGYVRMHQGLDIDGDTGDEIVAFADGVVLWAGERGGYGNTVIIDHGNQFATLYAHQSEMLADVGDTVKGGDVIGFVGNTGLSSGPHLHFELRDLGVPVDPEDYLNDSVAE